MSDAPSRNFKSCLFASLPGWDTLGLVRALHSAGYAVLERPTFEATLAIAVTAEFDVVLWSCDGREEEPLILERLATGHAPSIAIVRDPEPALVAACLDAGAEACLHVDADARIVAAQVSALLRRRQTTSTALQRNESYIQIGDVVVDCERCEVERGGTLLPLTATEFRIVEFMARNAGRTLRPQEILNAATDDYAYSTREAQEVFKVYARRIRRKLEPDESNPRYLVNVRGFGYRLEAGLTPREMVSATFVER